jgi:hypothetical protein
LLLVWRYTRGGRHVEPGAVFRHLGALLGRRMALAGRGLVAVLRRAPTQLDAIVHVVRHLEIHDAVDHILQRGVQGELLLRR